MDNFRWQELVGRIKDSFTVEDEYTRDRDEGPGSVEGLIFTGPQGRMKVERSTHPRVTGTHAVTSNRIGANATVAYDYDEEDVVQTVRLYRENGDAWVPVEDSPLTGGPS